MSAQHKRQTKMGFFFLDAEISAGDPKMPKFWLGAVMLPDFWTSRVCRQTTKTRNPHAKKTPEVVALEETNEMGDLYVWTPTFLAPKPGNLAAQKEKNRRAPAPKKAKKRPISGFSPWMPRSKFSIFGFLLPP